MKNRIKHVKTLTVCVLVLTGSIAANNLSELRRSHDVESTKHRIVRRVHNENRAKSRQRNLSAKKDKHQRRLRRAKRKQRKIDRKLDHKHAKKRNFQTIGQFRQVRRTKHRVAPKHAGHSDKHYMRRIGSRDVASRRVSRYGDIYDWSDRDYFDSWEPIRRQRGYRHYRRSWYLTYLYERAPFYDRHGYRYGYFSRRGFIFEGEFYRYDRYYTYRDRLRGRGLFERRYYRPIYSQFGDLFAELGRGGFYFYANFDY